MKKNDNIEEDIKKILNKIRPYLNQEGGDLEYLGFKDGIVYIRMLGACMGCGQIDETVKNGIEALLIEYVPDVIEVKNLALGDDIDGLFD